MTMPPILGQQKADSAKLEVPLQYRQPTLQPTPLQLPFAGCSETDNITVVITENGSFGIPNAFTPNGDQKNDLFEVLTDGGIAITQCRIFDRWGQLVYDNPLAQWDGTFEGKPLPMDVYVYQIGLTRINGVQETHTGDVTLLR
jgi:gliding motility-associated-like protein